MNIMAHLQASWTVRGTKHLLQKSPIPISSRSKILSFSTLRGSGTWDFLQWLRNILQALCPVFIPFVQLYGGVVAAMQ